MAERTVLQDGNNKEVGNLANPLIVTASFSPSGTQDVNVVQIGGNAVTTTIPVSGTVTSNAGTNLNTSALALETTAIDIKNAVQIIDNAISGSEMQVDVVGALPAGNNNIGDVDIASSVLPTGASTLAEQQTQTTHLAAIETAVEIIDNAISGNEMQVDVVAALPTGTNSIGQVTANAGTNLNTSALLTTAAHDAAFGTAGSADAQVRSIQGIASMTPVQVGDNSASLSVDWNGTQPVTGSGNATGALRVELPTNGTGIVGLAAGTNNIGDIDVLSVNGFAAHDGAIAGNPLIVGGVSSAAAPSSVSADQEAVRAWFLRNGAQATVITAAGALIGGDASNGLDVDVTRIASGAIQSGAVASGAVASGAIASGAIASGAIATGAIAAGTASIAQTEDTAHSGGEHLIKIGERRIDTCATSSDTSGDWSTPNQSGEGASWATLTPTTTSGLSTLNSTSSDGGTALTNGAQAIKASAGNLYGYYIYNPNTAAQFVQFYNTASGSVTVGTTNPLFMLTVPATAAANLMFPYPVSFGTAMSWAATSTAGGNGAPATAMDAVAWYK